MYFSQFIFMRGCTLFINGDSTPNVAPLVKPFELCSKGRVLNSSMHNY